jgi:hypothetical protein
VDSHLTLHVLERVALAEVERLGRVEQVALGGLDHAQDSTHQALVIVELLA